MALSRVCEIEIDSTFRTSNSNSPTDFEFQLPYTFPNYKNAQIQLGYAFVPNSWYNVTQTQTFTCSLGTVSIPAGSYTSISLVTALTTGVLLPSGGLVTGSTPFPATILIGFNQTLKKIILQNTGGASVTFTPSSGLTTVFTWMGFSSDQIATISSTGIAATSFIIAENNPNINQDRDARFYIRLNGLESKVMMPQLPSQIFTFALTLKDTGASFSYVTIPQDDLEQTLFLSENQLRSNSTLRIQLVDSFGNILDLNGRNWKFVLRVEPSHKMEYDDYCYK
jgi:hypothetical protein